MSKESETPSSSGHVATVSRNMADAVKYLAGVASDAGLNQIARRLNRIRTALVRSAGVSESDPNDRQKLN